MDTYPKSNLLILNSWVVVVTWVFLATFLVSLVLVGFGIGEAFIGIFAFIPMLIIGILHVILSYKLKCPACNKLVTGQGLSASHANSRKYKYLNEWATVVLDVMIKRNFICFHCGKEYEVHL